MPELLKLVANRPEVIALQFETGRRVESQFGGEQALFTLMDGRRLYTPLSLADKIERELCIGRNEPMEICKREIGYGKDKRVTYDVKRLETQTPQASAPPSVATQRNGTAAQVMPQQQAHVNAPPPVRWDELEATAPPAPSTNAAKMMACFMAAIEAISEAEVFAERKNLVLNFTTDNITSAALSIYINESKAGR